ncbi:hypothetical protein ACFRJ8_00210 [Arthrobacter sp. NPDC056886]|uniref:hypothetical protein n=1 Tax=Arthrobacter sp. NPDC056886 TaxID=3345960 RepID=UPI00366EFDD6
MKAFFVYSTGIGRHRPPAAKAVACNTRLRTFSHGGAVTKIARVLRAGGADIIAEAKPFLTWRGR